MKDRVSGGIITRISGVWPAGSGRSAAGARVLMAGDGNVLNASVTQGLEAAGFEVTIATTLLTSLRRLWAERPHLVVVDAGTASAEWDGWDLCRRVRDICDVPLILILRNDCPAERVRGLQMGADDVIPPPFEVQELVLRAGNVLRRAHSAVLRGRFQHPDYDLVLSPALSDVWARGHPIPITPIERKVLKLLVERAGRTIGYDELVEHVWRESASAEGRTRLRQVVTGLRRKIEPDPNHPLFIKTCHGLGYQFATQHWCWIDDQETNSHQPSAISH